jgi:hypothetical protein
MCFDFLYSLYLNHSNKNSKWYYRKIYAGLHVKFLSCFSGFNKTWTFSTNFRKKSSNIQFNENQVSGRRVVHADGQTDRHDKLIAAFRNFANHSFLRNAQYIYIYIVALEVRYIYALWLKYQAIIRLCVRIKTENLQLQLLMLKLRSKSCYNLIMSCVKL